MRGRATVWVLWALTRAVALGVGWIVQLVDRGNVFQDTQMFGRWAVEALDGTRIPYADFPWEYPPAAFPVIAPPSIAVEVVGGTSLVPYGVAFVAMMLAVDAVVLAFVQRRSPGGWRHPAVALWLIGPALLGATSWNRLDLFPAAAALLAVFAAGTARTGWSGAAAGAGAALKLWPMLLAPVQRTRQAAVQAVGVALGAVVIFAAVSFALTGSVGYTSVLDYQSDRGLQIESLVGLPLVWLHHLDVAGFTTEFAYGAFEIRGPGASVLADIATVVLLAGLALVAVAHARLMRVDAGRRGVAMTAVLVLLVVLVTNKVFSPQYVLWLLAVMVAAAMLDPRTWRGFVIPALLLAALTQAVFPTLYGDVIYGAWPGLLLMTARDVLLVGILVMVVRRYVALLRTPELLALDVADEPVRHESLPEESVLDDAVLDVRDDSVSPPQPR